MTDKAATDSPLEELLAFLRDNRGFDFTGYKRSTLARRVAKRMHEVGVDDHAAYRRHLEEHPDEFTALFNTILINVTGFFRDPEAWEILAGEYLPALLERKADEPLRVWSAGCASGEETYTLAMVLAEILGTERFGQQVKIYATDVDDEALAQARQAAYAPRDLEAVPETLRDKYFEPARGGRRAFRSDLRRLVIFGRNDLVRDAPISHLDLLVSRNALMYFNADTQARILNRFHFALEPGGLLFLGKAEMMRAHAALFTPVHLKARIFVPVARADPRERLMAMAHPGRHQSQERLLRELRLREGALDAEPSAQIVVDPQGSLVLANAAARRLFALAPADVGRPLRDLTLSYRPLELRGPIEKAMAERHAVRVTNVEHPAGDGALHHFDVHVVPIVEGERGVLGVAVTFVDETHFHRLHAELQESSQALETAFEELQSTNEELETTNEELQSTIEELETTNEELQSTNEELETMNEELQSTNEELETLNDELQLRTNELNDVNASMSSLLTSLRAAMVVLDRNADIRIWSSKAEDLWGMRREEVEGKGFLNLDIGLPVEQLKPLIRTCVDGASEFEEVVLDATNRRGRPIRCRVSVTPFLGPDRDVRGSVLLMEEWRETDSAPS